MIKVCVLYSEKFARGYVGMTSDLRRRLDEHNMGRTKSTKAFIPWELIYSESFEDYEEARKREKYLKSAAGRRFLKPKLETDGE